MSNGYVPPILKQKGFENVVCISPVNLGASSVYKVSRPGVGDWIVKRIEKEYAVLYRAEKNILSTLRHDFLPIIFDVFEDAQALYIAMEYIPGESLLQLIKSDSVVSEESAKKYFIQLCELFEYLHSKDVVHKDCKPSNIMLSKHDNVYLIDFGISKSPDDNPSGRSLRYASPEQLKNPDIGDHKTDIFSLGATMYSLLTKELPGKGFYDPKVVMENLKIRSDISKNFRQVILKCMAHKPSHRFQTMDEVKKALLRKDWIWKSIVAIILMLISTVIIFFGVRIWEEEATDRLIIQGNDYVAIGDYQSAMSSFETYIYRRPLSALGYDMRRAMLVNQGKYLESLEMYDQTEDSLFYHFVANYPEFRNTWVSAVDGVIGFFINTQSWNDIFTLLENSKVQILGDIDTFVQHVYSGIKDHYIAIAYAYYTERDFMVTVDVLNTALFLYPNFFYDFELLNLRAVAMLSYAVWGNGNFDRFVVYANEALSVAQEEDAAQANELRNTLNALGMD